MKKVKFAFDLMFQEEILHYIIKDKNGILSLSNIKDSYFTLINHQIIAKVLKKFFKSHKKIPQSAAVLIQLVQDIVQVKSIANLLTKEDIEEIKSLIKKFYSEPLLEGEFLQEKIIQFSMYIEMKELNDSFDLSDFAQYEEYSKKISKVLSRKENKRDSEIYLIRDVVRRQLQRQSDPQVIPTPFRQLNMLTNGGGYPKHSIIVALDKSKATKTFTLINVARSYLKMQKVVLYIDVENGATEIMTRMEQSTLNKNKGELLSGEFDQLEQKHLRKYRRFGSEFIVKKLPANIGNVNHIADLIDKIYNDSGLRVNVLIIDFMGKMGSLSKDQDDFTRISNVYIEVSNLATDKDLDIVWTAQHVTRAAESRRESRYEESDIAKCIDIGRHASAIFGLNSTHDERDNGVQRWEMIIQRDGPSYGRCLFNVDLENQRFQEFTISQRKAYDEKVAPELDKKFKSNKDAFKKKELSEEQKKKMEEAKDI